MSPQSLIESAGGGRYQVLHATPKNKSPNCNRHIRYRYWMQTKYWSVLVVAYRSDTGEYLYLYVDLILGENLYFEVHRSTKVYRYSLDLDSNPTCRSKPRKM